MDTKLSEDPDDGGDDMGSWDVIVPDGFDTKMNQNTAVVPVLVTGN
jgi:hypothetical protein